MLLLAGLALAAEPGPYVRAAPLGIHAGLDLGWPVGGNGAGYRPGFGETVRVGYSVSNTSEILLTVDHAHHVLRDVGAYFPDLPAGSGDGAGGRDVIGLGLGLRVGIDRVDEWSLPARRLRVYPFVQVGAGVGFTDTTVETAGFGGPVVLHSVAVLPRLSAAPGAELRLSRRLSLLPRVDCALLVAEDVGEVDGRSHVGAEARVAPAMDVRVGF